MPEYCESAGHVRIPLCSACQKPLSIVGVVDDGTGDIRLYIRRHAKCPPHGMMGNFYHRGLLVVGLLPDEHPVFVPSPI